MLYINSYLDRLGALIREERDVKEVYDLTDPVKILNMFKNDCDEIVELYRNGIASYEEVRRNLNLLKTYVVTQLGKHFEKVKEIAQSKGISIDRRLEPEIVNKVALHIDLMERELGKEHRI